jgi:hypothetical protein
MAPRLIEIFLLVVILLFEFQVVLLVIVLRIPVGVASHD